MKMTMLFSANPTEKISPNFNNEGVGKKREHFAADNILIVWVFFGENKAVISCKSSNKLTIHMKYQVLFSGKNIKRK